MALIFQKNHRSSKNTRLIFLSPWEKFKQLEFQYCIKWDKVFKNGPKETISLQIF